MTSSRAGVQGSVGIVHRVDTTVNRGIRTVGTRHGGT